MLAESKKQNPELEHIEGDMRTLRLGRTFDGVLGSIRRERAAVRPMLGGFAGCSWDRSANTWRRTPGAQSPWSANKLPVSRSELRPVSTPACLENARLNMLSSLRNIANSEG